MKKKKSKISFAMFLVTIGIVYGDIGTSPLYVMKSIISGNGGISQVNSDFVIGSLSLVIWTITLLTTVKYVLIAMRADHHGEGGIFALYSLVKSHGKWLIIPAMIGGSALLADGVLTPAVTVTTAIEGLRSIPLMNTFLGESQVKVILITLTIITVLFAVQSAGTSSIGKAFGPVMLLWFGFLGMTGIINVTRDLSVLKAFNPVYAVRILYSPYNKVGFMILGSVFLAATGAEALYSDMGHVGRENIYASWPFVKACLILNYLGQGAWIIANSSNSEMIRIEELNPFFMMLPESVRPFAILLSTAAAIIASQALITGSYTLVSEAISLNLMPSLQIRYPSDTKGQIYIHTVNTLLFIGCACVVLYFKSSARMEAAYGLAITVTMLMTTLLLSIYLAKEIKQPVLAAVIAIVFGSIECVFFISSLSKFFIGGYITVLIALILLAIMVIWYRGTEIESRHSVNLKIKDYVSNISQLHNDTELPYIADNLVYVEDSNHTDEVERHVLYSILDKDYKRAKAYWLINVLVDDNPKTMSYSLDTYGTDFLFRVHLNLGYKVPQHINVYLRQIVSDLLADGTLPKQDKKYSIYGPSDVGNFKFCFISKSVPENGALSKRDKAVIKVKYAIQKMVGTAADWYGLDTSTQILETVPLITTSPDTFTQKISRQD